MRQIDRRAWIDMERQRDDAAAREARVSRYERRVAEGKRIFEEGDIPEDDLAVLRRLRDDEGRAVA